VTNPPAVSVDVGTPAPLVRLPASSGGEISLADYRDRANVVLFFVRAYN
jgi:peroxiredoxin